MFVIIGQISPAYMASDMWEVNGHLSPVNAPFQQKD